MRPLFALLVCLIANPVLAAEVIGFKEISLPAPRPLHVAMWYPAAGGTARLIADTRVFNGFTAVPGAGLADGPHPLVVLSHGYGGNWTNQDWLAAALAGQGYIVAAPNHPGTTTGDMATPGVSMLGERPRDVSRVIDAVLATASVPAGRIAVIGHSLGGWTSLEIAGARVDRATLQAACTAAPSRTCGEVGAHAGMSEPMLEDAHGDPRVRAAVALDPGVTRGFASASLARVQVPLLVIAAGSPVIDLPGSTALPVPDLREAPDLVAQLPAATTRLLTLPGATHYSFLPVCKPSAAALLGGEAVICQDAPSADRAALQRQVLDAVTPFLAAALQ